MKVTTKEELHLFSQVLQKYLSPTEVERLARTTEFVRRTSKYRGQELVTLCVWLSHNLASTSLTQLCSELEATTEISMSPEGLNQRLNEKAVAFLRELFARLLKIELGSSSSIPSVYQNHFLRIRILDSTTFQVPDSLTEHYPGAGGCGHTAGVKIQLEYDLHSGQFLNMDIGAGKKNDKTFGTTCLSTLRPGDLCIRDLGYFSLEDLDQMDQRGVSYVSRLKLNNRIYQKNSEPAFFQDGTIKKQTEYLPLDLEEIMHGMQPGETVEVRDTYIGRYQKLPARVILYRLTEVQVKKRRKDQAYKEKKKGMKYSDKSKRLTEINVYITNIAWEIVPKEHVHDLYSLRWQVEIVFKTWKSFFQMDRCKDVKRERLECHLYGQLIAILICSSTLFRMRELLLREKQKELSEYKAFYTIQTYFPLFHQAIQQQNTQAYTKILLRLFHLLGKNGRKSHRYKKKTIFDILGVVYEYTISNAKVA
ncbi:IS4 family transposase [Paenibacillus mendelii]|uniref:IS4 family transposase n=1 Tax=Paenibacillus mendelii TaxID=206163 RepID=A0ABV6J7I9_9BACL|nr:IS4 family transposase [Paenibacillus mendelii]MCQ6562198.1 IS4 family transposase [Paenibacillus mendelii]